MQFPGAIEQARSVSWLDGVKGDMNQALVLLYLVLLVLVVLINRCLGFLSGHLVVVMFVLTKKCPSYSGKQSSTFLWLTVYF